MSNEKLVNRSIDEVGVMLGSECSPHLRSSETLVEQLRNVSRDVGRDVQEEEAPMQHSAQVRDELQSSRVVEAQWATSTCVAQLGV